MKSLNISPWIVTLVLLAATLWGTHVIAASCSTSAGNCNASCQVSAPIVQCVATDRDAYCFGYNENGVIVAQTEAHCRITIVPIGEGGVVQGTGVNPGP